MTNKEMVLDPVAATTDDTEAALSRREFLRVSGAAGLALPLAGAGLLSSAYAEETTGTVSVPKNPGDLHVAVIGVGAQGRVLIESCLKIPGIRFRAICDIWSYSQQYGKNFLKKEGHVVNVYENFEDMLANEKGLDAVIVASPDFMHAPHTNACLHAGLHVYCEKEMSNTLEAARTMVQTAHETKKLLQIGHQRRSNPRYIHAIDRVMHEAKLLGRVTHANAQWNRAKSEDLGWPAKNTIDQATLEKYGYESMTHFRNWRWYRKYGGGPIVDLGSHQIDIFSWVFGTNPKSVVASGGINYYDTHEWYDNVMCIYEFENAGKVGRAFYQVLTTTKHGGFYETFMGDDGSLQISEVPSRGNSAMREEHARPWDEFAKRGLLLRETVPLQRSTTRDIMVDVRVSKPPGQWPLPVELAKPAHQPHLENFFDAVRYGKKLNCPAELGYETAVAVLKANESVALGQKLSFTPEDFHA
jgi:predicted dehydrogenase